MHGVGSRPTLQVPKQPQPTIETKATMTIMLSINNLVHACTWTKTLWPFCDFDFHTILAEKMVTLIYAISFITFVLVSLAMDTVFPTCPETRVLKNRNCARCGDKSSKFKLTPMPMSFKCTPVIAFGCLAWERWLG